jgi:RNA polymerase sigma-70 factor (ECF subfamily)
MDDREIVALFFERSETAIKEADLKYGKYCYSVAYNILANHEDSEESVNDTYIEAWNAIPPHRPLSLSSFLGKITRRLAIDRWRSEHAQKRGGGEMSCVLEELEECVTVDLRHADRLAGLLSDFLESQDELDRKLFMGRYWHAVPVKDLAGEYGLTPNAVSLRLGRIRERLRAFLEEGGYPV